METPNHLIEIPPGPAAAYNPAPPPARAQPDSASLVQLITSLLASVSLLGLAAIFALQGLISFRQGNTEQLLAISLLATGMGFSALLLLPSAWFSLLRMMGRRPMSTLPGKFPRRMALLIGLLVVMPIALITGSYIVDELQWAWLLMPPFHIIAITIPITWLIHLGSYNLPLGSAQRKWGIFSSSLVLGPLIIIGLEIAAGALLFFGMMIFLLSQPGIVEAFQRVIELVKQDPTLPPQQITSELIPYLQKPVLVYAGIIFLTVIVPLLEELAKPISVWFLSGRKLSPPEGFAIGVLCGAGFAMMENLGYTAAAEGSWGSIALARSGTAVMHMVTSGMMGWALSSTWRDGRYARIAVMYITAVFIHGFWNGLTISFGLLGTQMTGVLDSALLFQLIAAGVLGLLLLILLVVLNGAMQRAIIPLPVTLPPVENLISNEEYQNNGISASTD